MSIEYGEAYKSSPDDQQKLQQARVEAFPDDVKQALINNYGGLELLTSSQAIYFMNSTPETVGSDIDTLDRFLKNLARTES